MSRGFKSRLASFDRLVHEPARLAVLTTLSACEKADFVFLRNLTGLTKGNLSSHLVKLEHGGLVAIEKAFIGKQPITCVALTGEGRGVLKAYWKRFDQVRKGRWCQSACSTISCLCDW